ncbi:histidine kinase [Roseateles sp. DAIF2]|uniref:sensor histidine kinase n=1 Tax=Roseateles sp. DAIF2 TaxID=2714952 RepID=UPI0018A2EF50|nr:histidine kinase [Roseateles sp. DAIF2]QPF76027.1 histidine kinase [Roseateles sp. DAIF2]
MNHDRLLARIAQPGFVLRVAALAVCVLELWALVGALLGHRTEPYDGLLATLHRLLGGASGAHGLTLLSFALVLLFAVGYWRLASQGGTDRAPAHALARIVALDLLALAVTPGLPFLVTALGAIILRLRPAFGFALAQVGLSVGLYLLLPSEGQRLEQLRSGQPLWLDVLGQLMAMVALHGMAFGLGRMAAAEAEKRRWLQAMLAEKLSAERLQAEQLRYAERALMARELHDVVGHHLTALNLQLQLGDALLRRADTAGASQAVEKARGSAERLLADVRAAVSAERASQRIDLSEALQVLAEGIASTRIELDIAPAARDLSPRLAHALLRCVQEAVTNSVRHASAARVRVSLAVLGDAPGDGEADHQQVLVTVDDDGGGAPRLTAGNGLKGMAERMAELGGSMTLARQSPGFKIELRCPRTA